MLPRGSGTICAMAAWVKGEFCARSLTCERRIDASLPGRYHEIEAPGRYKVTCKWLMRRRAICPHPRRGNASHERRDRYCEPGQLSRFRGVNRRASRIRRMGRDDDAHAHRVDAAHRLRDRSLLRPHRPVLPCHPRAGIAPCAWRIQPPHDRYRTYPSLYRKGPFSPCLQAGAEWPAPPRTRKLCAMVLADAGRCWHAEDVQGPPVPNQRAAAPPATAACGVPLAVPPPARRAAGCLGATAGVRAARRPARHAARAQSRAAHAGGGAVAGAAGRREDVARTSRGRREDVARTSRSALIWPSRRSSAACRRVSQRRALRAAGARGATRAAPSPKCRWAARWMRSANGSAR